MKTAARSAEELAALLTPEQADHLHYIDSGKMGVRFAPEGLDALGLVTFDVEVQDDGYRYVDPVGTLTELGEAVVKIISGGPWRTTTGRYVFTAGEPLKAGMHVTPDANGRLFRAKPGDPMVGAMGVLDDCEPGDHVKFEAPRGGLGRKLIDKRETS